MHKEGEGIVRKYVYKVKEENIIKGEKIKEGLVQMERMQR
jgi:hypothetical protein